MSVFSDILKIVASIIAGIQIVAIIVTPIEATSVSVLSSCGLIVIALVLSAYNYIRHNKLITRHSIGRNLYMSLRAYAAICMYSSAIVLLALICASWFEPVDIVQAPYESLITAISTFGITVQNVLSNLGVAGFILSIVGSLLELCCMILVTLSVLVLLVYVTWFFAIEQIQKGFEKSIAKERYKNNSLVLALFSYPTIAFVFSIAGTMAIIDYFTGVFSLLFVEIIPGIFANAFNANLFPTSVLARILEGSTLFMLVVALLVIVFTKIATLLYSYELSKIRTDCKIEEEVARLERKKRREYRRAKREARSMSEVK